jgi:hypothetical protein
MPQRKEGKKPANITSTPLILTSNNIAETKKKTTKNRTKTRHRRLRKMKNHTIE